MLEHLDPPFLDLHAATLVARDHYEVRTDARRFENWETYVAGKIGLGVAADYARGWGLGEIRDRVYGLANELRRRLAALPGVTVRDLGVERCGIVTLTAAGHSASAIQQALRERAINATVSRLTSTRLDMEARGLSELLRVSVHYYNSEEEIERLVAALREVLRR